MSSGNGELSVSVKSYNSNIVIVFSLLWIMFIAVQLISRPYKKMEFPLVTNRLSGNLSNIGFLVTGCLFGGITSSLVGVLLRLITYFMFDRSQVVFNRFFLSDLLLGIFVAILYMLLFSALGYFIGVLAQLNVSFVIIIPAVILGVLRVYNDFSQSVFKFFAFEVSLIMFVLKVIITSTILFSFSIFLSNRKEVSK
ncbi:hypothetical protein [Desulfosporosinus sp. OT]|uniref:hypothetical protein n=1 Tax=Desulfosporosinus sp. OT TaxID=913865 RepID=UPI001FA738CD|nr:hypothetical protein [Desulfosporosinus sp. OT]